MTAPVFSKRDALDLNKLLTGWQGFDALEKPVRMPEPLQPAETVAEFLAAMARTPDGRAVVEWLMDITFRAPFRATGRDFQETALLAATRQGIEGVGEAILAAIKLGAETMERRHQRSDHA